MPVPGYTPFYNNSSPYKFTRIVRDFMAYYVHRPVRPQPDDRLFIVTDQRYVNRPDLLATDFYGDPDLWWVIPVRNGLQDPVFDIRLNSTLAIPSESFVRSIT